MPIMETRVLRYQTHARDCVRLAARADTVEARVHFLDLAQTWIESALAEQANDAKQVSLTVAGWSAGFV
jgi:hypothetical protein